MDNNNVNSILDTTIEKMRSVAGADVVVGEKIIVDENITIIPVSKVSFGFASGGSDFGLQKNFAGAGGGGMCVSPVAFIVINNGNIKLVNINPSETALDKVISNIPEMVDKVKGFFKDDSKN